MLEKDYVGLSDASCAFAGGGEEEEGDNEELELGLSLGANKKLAGGDGGRNKAGAWGDYGGGGCRILTAKDFPAPRASPLSSSSSSSSDGAKRVRGSAGGDAGGSPTPPTQVVGWPPIRAFRINSLVNQAKDTNSNISDAEAATKKNGSGNECRSSMNKDKKPVAGTITRFIKVNMDGDPIGRKVDLNAHQSYNTLALSLEQMFNKPPTGLGSTGHGSRLLGGSSEFALTYEDKDGDWMLVGDVPWGMFLDTVKRLRIMRTSDANGLAPTFQSSNGGLLRSKVA